MRTIQLRPHEGAATPKELDLLQGTDLEGPRTKRTGRGRSDLHGQFGPYPLHFPLRLGRHHRLGTHTR